MSLRKVRGKRESPLQRSADSLQENIHRSGAVAASSYTLIGAILMFGGIGYAIDRWQGSAPWYLAGGLFLGVVVGMYELAKTVWHK